MNDIKWINAEEYIPGYDTYCKTVAYLVKGKAYIELMDKYKGSADHCPKIEIEFYKIMDRFEWNKGNYSLENASISSASFYCCQNHPQVEQLKLVNNLPLKDPLLQAKIESEYHRAVNNSIGLHSNEIQQGSFLMFKEKIKEWCEPEDYIFFNSSIKYWTPLLK